MKKFQTFDEFKQQAGLYGSPDMVSAALVYAGNCLLEVADQLKIYNDNKNSHVDPNAIQSPQS